MVKRNGERGSARGLNVRYLQQNEDEPKSQLPGAAAGTDASFQVKVGANLFLNCKTGLGMSDGEQTCSWILILDKQAQKDFREMGTVGRLSYWDEEIRRDFRWDNFLAEYIIWPVRGNYYPLTAFYTARMVLLVLLNRNLVLWFWWHTENLFWSFFYFQMETYCILPDFGLESILIFFLSVF